VHQYLALLVDDAYPGFYRLFGVGELLDLAIYQVLPISRLIVAIEDFQEGRFACAVFAKKSENLSAMRAKADVVKCFDAWKPFGYVLEFESAVRQLNITAKVCNGVSLDAIAKLRWMRDVMGERFFNT
jgi:hypothetical protein